MQVAVNECTTRMWTDKYHRVEFTSIRIRERDGANLVEGWMRADTPEAAKVYPRPSDVQFSAAIPAGLDDFSFHGVCTNMFYKIQNGESLMGLDFTPPPPPAVEAETNWAAVLLFTLVAGAVVGMASSSRG
jgi:hypothetical protein